MIDWVGSGTCIIDRTRTTIGNKHCYQFITNKYCDLGWVLYSPQNGRSPFQTPFVEQVIESELEKN